MQLLLPHEIAERIVLALTQAGRREIGGVLMGEHLEQDIFRIKDLTIQTKGGTFATFVRVVQAIIAPLQAFFRATKHDYERFNYIGEWHSHHSFELRPSGRDHATMYDLIDDPSVGARFAVLMLVKLKDRNRLKCSVTVYRPHMNPLAGCVVQE